MSLSLFLFIWKHLVRYKKKMTKPKAHVFLSWKQFSFLFFLNVDENPGLKRFPKTKQSKLMKIIFKPNVTAVRRFFVALVDLNVDESLFAFFLLIEPQDFFQSRFRWRLRYKKKNAGENWLIFVEDWNLNQKICTFLQFLVDFFLLILLAFSWLLKKVFLMAELFSDVSKRQRNL